MNTLIIIRHAIAEERSIGLVDATRALTADGTEKMKLAACGLQRIQPELDLLVSSSLTRAIQTADLVAACYQGVARKESDLLSPGMDLAKTVHWLDNKAKAESIGIVGHEPDLGALAGWLISGTEDDYIPLKKGSACRIDFPGIPDAGNCILRWFLTPKQLRMIGA